MVTILSDFLLNLLSIDIVINIPKWTDILQASAAAIGIPLTVFTLYKLVMKDKQRESEIQSLSTIASQLTEMQIETEKRYKTSKKPNIDIKCETNLEKKFVKIYFTNTNNNTSLISYNLNNDKSDFREFTASTSTINTLNGNQHFWIILSYKESSFDFSKLNLDYVTEEGYTFIQDISIWFENNKCVFSPSPIIDIENSPHNE